MNAQVKYPFQKQREGAPLNTYEKVGPFTLRISNKGFYEVYEVAVTGGVTILKQASRPGMYDICTALNHALMSGEITLKVFDNYRVEADQYFQEHPIKQPQQWRTLSR